MGLFGRKPRMVGFGGPKAEAKPSPKPERFRAPTPSRHSTQSGNGPWSGKQADAPQDLEVQLAELKKRSPAIGGMIEKFASRGPDGAAQLSNNIARTVRRWVVIGLVLFFVLPFVTTLLMMLFGA